LDEEQNKDFTDNYLNIKTPLNNVLFIASCNDSTKLDPIIKNRMKLIKLKGYTLAEKLDICNVYIIPELLAKIPLFIDYLKFTDTELRYIVSKTENEPGMRQLKKNIETIINKLYSTFLILTNKNITDTGTTTTAVHTVSLDKYIYNKISKHLDPNTIHSQLCVTKDIIDVILDNINKSRDLTHLSMYN
jgi:ATP-dependent Lon protease